ncbi:MAG TPA: M28 family peptidase, partial [Nitrospirales bacterium]|nr:M28 family peptidase [Nitrospirales bacterium]
MSPNEIDLQQLRPSTDLGRMLHRHVAFLASRELKGRKPGTDGNRRAAEYLVERFHELGLEPLPSLHGFTQPLAKDLGPNIVGARTPSGTPQHWILLGAHYDHLGEIGGQIYAGADDNASAVAILLEVARRLPSLKHCGVLFVSF